MGELKILKLKDGDDVIESLKEFASKNNIQQGYIKEAEGKIKDFEISAFSGKGSIENYRDKNEQDVIAINGQITISKGNPVIQLKVSVSRAGLRAVSGLLLSAKAGESLDIAIEKRDMSKMIYA